MARFWISFIVLLASAAVVIAPAVAGNKGKAGSKGKPNIVLFGQGHANVRGLGNNQGRGNANNGGRDIGLGNARSGVPNGILSGGTGLPPGLAKKGQLPPGLAKRDQLPPGLAKGHAVPPGLAKRDQLPPGLSQ